MSKNLLDQVGDLRTYHTVEDGKNYISYEQNDVEPVMDFAHAMREEADTAKVSPDFFNYAHLPDTVVLELIFKHKINPLLKLTPAEERRMYNLLETTYK